MYEKVMRQDKGCKISESTYEDMGCKAWKVKYDDKGGDKIRELK